MDSRKGQMLVDIYKEYNSCSLNNHLIIYINYLIILNRIYGLKPLSYNVGILPRMSYVDLKTMLKNEEPEKDIQRVSKSLHDILDLYKKSMRVTRNQGQYRVQ